MQIRFNQVNETQMRRLRAKSKQCAGLLGVCVCVDLMIYRTV